jgi:fucose 4-O-acetylase-like acetyltransferase
LFYLLAPLNFIFPLILPLFYFMAVSGYIATYAAYPVIEKYMIEPQAEDGGPPADELADES